MTELTEIFVAIALGTAPDTAGTVDDKSMSARIHRSEDAGGPMQGDPNHICANGTDRTARIVRLNVRSMRAVKTRSELPGPDLHFAGRRHDTATLAAANRR
ncbi:hypothetical protein FDV58_36280 [Bradyrhizobium elkanii]|uniref:Uncharacterized protein n=1 Tax=Bradyrhizobium elkanii TaxID=29448 RepID=A0A4U6RI65_BRAEL|nr:hypothetical protein [Bradyrhizobium elkanii]TKV73670.1 hypothetical protein FDV58_36280 [Bradyrhizobium elkanii]